MPALPSIRVSPEPRFRSLAEALEWATREEMGLVLEIKEAERPDLAVDRMAALLDATGAADRVIVISFDHVVLKRAVERHPGLRTEAITHARHADLVGVLRACGANSVSIELDMFHPDDGRALHDAGFSNRVHCRVRRRLQNNGAAGATSSRDVVEWIAEGLIDTISGDDVPFIARLVERAGKAATAMTSLSPDRARPPPAGGRGGRPRGRPARRRAIRPARTSPASTGRARRTW